MTKASAIKSVEGGCMCGATRFAFAGAPRFVSDCHCLECRRWTGAPYSTYVGTKDSEVTWTGAEPNRYASSPGVERLFCATCGTALAYRGDAWPGETHLMLGAFDDPTPYPPQSAVFVHDALPWLQP